MPPRVAGRVVAVCMVAALVGCGTDPDPERMNADLLTAAARGDTAAVRDLLADGADVDARDGLGRTAALAATHHDHPAVVSVLVDADADLDIQDDRRDNVLLYAGAEGRLAIVKLAVAAGADTTITNRFGGTALIPAAERGHVEVVRFLLTGSDVAVDHVNDLGWTALLEAIVLSDGGSRHQQVVRLLVDHGADVNLPDRDGVTPLRHARDRGFQEIAAVLEAAGAHL